MSLRRSARPHRRDRLGDGRQVQAVWDKVGWDARVQRNLCFALAALIEAKNANLLGLPRLLKDDADRRDVLLCGLATHSVLPRAGWHQLFCVEVSDQFDPALRQGFLHNVVTLGPECLTDDLGHRKNAPKTS